MFAITISIVVIAVSQNSVSAAGAGAVQQSETLVRLLEPSLKMHDPGATDGPITPNPYLAILPEGVRPDYAYWRNKMHEQALAKRVANLAALTQQTGVAQALIPIAETEPFGMRRRSTR